MHQRAKVSGIYPRKLSPESPSACYDTDSFCSAGMICTKCSPVQVINDAIADARGVCMREYATAPEVSVYGDPELTFAYVPSHLHHMIFELVKNSLKATNDKYEDSDEEPPLVKVIVAEGDEDIAVKVRASRKKVSFARCETSGSDERF